MKQTTTLFVLSSLLAIFEAKIIDKSDVIFPGKKLPTKSHQQHQQQKQDTPPIVAVANGDISNVLELEEEEEGSKYDVTPLLSVKDEHTSNKAHHHHSNHDDKHVHNHGRRDNHHGNHNNISDHHEYHKEKKSTKLKDSKARKVWRRLSKEAPGPDRDPCKRQKCKRKGLCMVNADTGKAQCIPRKLLRQKQRMAKNGKGLLKKKTKKDYKKAAGRKQGKFHASTYMEPEKRHKAIKKLKHEAEQFKSHYEEKKRHRLHHLRQHKHQGTNKNKLAMSPRDKTKDKPYKTSQKSLNSTKSQKVCSAKELTQMSSRLLDWFKVLQDQDNKDHDHVIQKRNSMKKELHEQGECICQAPVRYEFLVLDTDEDNILSGSELLSLEGNGYEHCIIPFVESCDHNHDGQLSDKEWCCCFADVLPPCLAKMEKIPTDISNNKPSVLPGAMVPQCDVDGFYKPLQCHASTGYCWCVDRNGVQIPDTSTQGAIDCEHLDELSEEEVSNLSEELD